MRKVKDYFYHKAKKDKYPARSVYKLEEIDRKYNIINKNIHVLDLGCSPGSWCKYCSKKIGEKGVVVGVDQKELKIESLTNIRFIQCKIQELNISDLKKKHKEFDVVLSDMAPFTTGVRGVDQAKSMELAETAYNIAEQVLKKGGHFVCKLFQGADTNILLNNMRERFTWVKSVKPKGTRKESFEIYLVGYNYKKR